MKQVLIKQGKAIVAEVPAPVPEAGEILVQVRRSCISVGTEMSGVRHSALPLWKRALQQPEKMAMAFRMAADRGVRRTWSLIEQRRNASHPTGYSAAGTVIAVGAGVENFRVGDRVACAGAQSAHHAEFIRVPTNLCALIPDELDWDGASTVTLGAIALQGIRRAQPTLGERFVVIGLGVLGLLTVQLLRANGCRTVGVDPDAARLDLARQLGMDVAMRPDAGDEIDEVARLTGGLGADGVIITAATSSDEVISAAFKMCRKKGRVVLVGDVGLNLNRSDFYAKEIDLLISTSYGPGRYDRNYEERGLDYPAAYVRWTENRNMQEYLDLLARGSVQVAPLISGRFPIEEATAAYSALGGGSEHRPVMVLLTYPDEPAEPTRKIQYRAEGRARREAIRVALIGAGAFAKSVHLPNLKDLDSRFALHAVVSRTSHTAHEVARQFGAEYATTEYEAVLADGNVDAVIITTRHNLHGSLALAALQAGKHVLVEKPLALRQEELDVLDSFIHKHGAGVPILLTGFNRRFSPYARRMSELVARRTAPFILNYRMNAGYIPLDHWVHGPEGGGRNLGEACHIYDLFTFLTGAEVACVSATPIISRSQYYAHTDNFVATVRFVDGSVTTLTYTALGARDYPKEVADLYVDGKVVVLEDYKGMTVHGSGRQPKSFKTKGQEKGWREELEAFGAAIRSGEWPIPWWQQMQATRIALQVETALRS
jgi:predicted dehydrogenase/threonine dehydrogenase-like Zn-dependent dehydrogenase